MPQKRTRTVLSLEEKKKVIKIKEDNPTFTLNEVAEAYYKQSKKVISQTTVGTIWNNRQAIMSGLPYNMKGKKQDISISAETMCKIEEAEASHKTVSESLVIELAQKVVLEHKLDPKLYFFSPAWARGIMHGKVDDKSILKVNQKSIENATVLTKPSSIEPAEKSASQLSGLERLPCSFSSNECSLFGRQISYYEGVSIRCSSLLIEDILNIAEPIATKPTEHRPSLSTKPTVSPKKESAKVEMKYGIHG